MSTSAPLRLGDPALRQVAAPLPVALIDSDDLRELLATLHETMDLTGALSVSAPEVGSPIRVFLVADPETGDRSEIINPEISFRSTKLVRTMEACLCTEELEALVDRVALVHIDGFSGTGERLCFDAKNLLAVAIQHAVDHLDGVLFVDRCDTRSLAFSDIGDD
jgi:peptide deformylase